jgi:hypothetical protein
MLMPVPRYETLRCLAQRVAAIGPPRLFLVVFCFLATGVACSPQPLVGNGGIPKWHEFTVVKDEDPFFASSSYKSVEEMEKVGGFAFIFPSYLPEHMSPKMNVYAARPSITLNGETTTYGPFEEIAIFRGVYDAPYITLSQQLPPLPDHGIATKDAAFTSDIAGQSVWCVAEDPANEGGVNPILECEYLMQDRAFHFLFQWRVDKPVEGLVTDDQREEALKVITSMIEAPLYWQDAASP